MTGQYKVISDNLGEYSVVSKDNVLVATEIQHRITAETFCEKLNILAEENEQLKQSYKEFEDECQSTFNAMNIKQNDLYRKNFKLKEENEQLKKEIIAIEKRADKVYDENKELRKENIYLEEDLNYYKAKAGSCEQGFIHNEKELHRYKKKVTETLQKYYTTIKTSEVLLTSEKNDLRLLLDTIADDLGVELE